MKKPYKLFILILTVTILPGILSAVFAEDKPKDSILTPEEQKEIKGYSLNLKELLRHAENNVKKVDKELEGKKLDERNRRKELLIRELVENGNAFYKEGRLKKAEEEWGKALEISKDPDMKDYVRDSIKRAKAEELQRKKDEKTRLLRVEEEREKTARMVRRLEEISREIEGSKKEAVKARAETPKKTERLPAAAEAVSKGTHTLPRAISTRQNILLSITILLMGLLFGIKISRRLKSKSGFTKTKEKKTGKEKSFEPRDLKKYLDEKNNDSDRDLFK